MAEFLKLTLDAEPHGSVGSVLLNVDAVRWVVELRNEAGTLRRCRVVTKMHDNATQAFYVEENVAQVEAKLAELRKEVPRDDR